MNPQFRLYFFNDLQIDPQGIVLSVFHLSGGRVAAEL
jgi:hypothetical protein